jgi:Ca2+-binding RTX toxin-like protein
MSHYIFSKFDSEVTWTAARGIAQSLGGDLVSANTPAENQILTGVLNANSYLWDGRVGPWIGLIQADGAVEPDGGWSWVDGSAVTFNGWLAGEPNNEHAQENRGHFRDGTQWNDLPDIGSTVNWTVTGFIAEFADNKTAIGGTDGRDYVLAGAVSNSISTGAGDDIVLAGDGNDVIDGGTGNDRMTGGAGNDTYYADSSGDILIEKLNEGTDIVFTSVSMTMRANVENLTQLGTGNIAATGNALDNVIRGNSGNNALNGGAGNDTLIGGLGNDSYTIDSANDTITEGSNAGVDLVNTSLSYTLGTGLDHLTLLGTSNLDGTGNSLPNRITGNAGVNTLRGEGGNDTIYGVLGADTMIGGIGSDTYVVNDPAALVVEYASQGTDTVQSTVTYTLTANVERLSLQGSNAIDGSGNAMANVMAGNSANNTLDGREGNDILSGGGGNDRFVFALGSIDKVNDFAVGVDKIVVSASGFSGGLVEGGGVILRATSGAHAIGPGGQFLYDTADGQLFYDADGQGGAGPRYFGVFQGVPSLTANDFEVIA